MDNTQKRIGCYLGDKEGGDNGSRTKIIDPNAFYGELDSSRNIPVNLEDLNISVKLTTRKKSRTTIFSDSSTSEAQIKEQEGVTINFIEGSDINGKKVLTTKFTELTTVFEKDTFNPETFGITNIDIDFNTSYTPMIKIDFVDVRGSSIFQNEANLLNNEIDNKYGVFFEFPYPLFELEIKGYYGQPVTYCLHMLKFNSKFNSQTGNFEISCEFIGYTYAMLSDMLIGVLKAIPFTTIGEKVFENYNNARKSAELLPILDLVELRTKISQISSTIQKVAETTEQAKVLKTFDEANILLDNIKINLFALNDAIGIPTKSTETLPETIFVVLSGNTLTQTEKDNFNRINNDIKKNVKDLNSLKIQGFSINENDIANPIRLTNLDLKKLEPDFEFLLPFGPITTIEEIDKFKVDLKNYINSYYTMSSDKEFSVYDLRSRFKLIEDKRTLLTDSEEQISKSLALEIKDTIKVKLGFEPTVRNMVEIFTSLIEVFIETLYEVSSKAESYQPRKELFDTVFSDNIRTDYLSGDIIDKVNYYPWPDYSEKEDTKAYVDTYLGSNPQIKGRTFDVPELEFIDNLLQAFLKANEKESQAELLIADNQTLFIPCNPLDTTLYSESINPYAKTEITKTDQAFRVFLIRAMTFLGYTNNQDYLTKGEDGEIQKMAKIEAQTLFQAIINPQIKILMKNISLESILAANGNVSGSDRPVVELSGNNYFYNYAAKGSGNVVKLLPIGFDLDGKDITILTDETAHPKQTGMTDFASEGNIFLTNYSPYYAGSGLSIDNFKYDDGGIYLDIKSPNEYLPTQEATLVDTTIGTESVLDLKSLQDNLIESAGFNSFGGSYGIQDFNKINFGGKLADSIPSMYVFYSNESTKNGLALPRAEGYISSYDFKKDGFNLYKRTNDPSQAQYIGDNKKLLHQNLGENRFLATSIDSATYPYINYQLSSSFFGSYQYLPLFGSEFYYLQKDAKMKLQNNFVVENVAEYYVKGLLFLNTLPFNINYSENEDPFNKPEIRHLFDIKAGFIHAPRLWAAYVGGLLWWLSKENPYIENGKILRGGRGKEDPIIWKHTCGDVESLFKAPNGNQYLPKNLFGDRNNIDENSPLITMPRQVKNKFKQVFFDFINGDKETDFRKLADKLEIYKGSATQFCSILDNLTKAQTAADASGAIIAQNRRLEYLGSSITDNLVNYDNYKIILPVDDTKETNIKLKYIFLELNDDADVNKFLVDSFTDEIIIVNTGVKIWQAPDFGIQASPLSNTDVRTPITVKKEIFEEYVKAFTDTMNELTKDVTIQGEEERQINEVFGSTNKDEIKLMLYRHCKNIYDKWIGGVSVSDNDDVASKILFQCGGSRQLVDKNLAKRDGHTSPKLIHSFRFVSRSFKDIGDELFVNPIPIENQISDFPNTSAYNVISGLLSDNKFNFIALPSFIDYRNDDMLKSVFTPYSAPYDGATCGPTFVCVYTGQNSKRLDIINGRYPNDGFDMRCINGTPDTSIPDDFKAALQSYEDPIAVFEVNYSQQNQNIFKDVVLDQSEFTETEESLKIVQDISTKGFENNPSFGGQNMYNIYAVRSYSAEIEMLGNAMIQPMMYFQLNNIPMFHGAYMIIRARHNIKPNHMTTWFTGVRIRAIETPIIDVTEAYMNLIETLNLSDVGKSSSASVLNTNGNAIIGANCGEFKLAKPITDGAEGFYNSKPIRDLIAILESESSGGYNAYNNGTAGQRGSVVYKPIEMTIAEIKAAQALTNANRIFAVGKYQLIPDTFNAMVSALGFNLNDKFNAEKQEKAGEWLIFKRRAGLKAYFDASSKGTEIQLQKAITDLGLEFASFPLYHMGFINNNRSGNGIYEDAIGYNSKQAAYAGGGGNPSESKICAQDVAKALIETWKRRNNNKEPEFTYSKLVSSANVATNNNSDSTQKLTSNDKSEAIIMGDSTVGVFNSVPNGLSKNKIDISFNKEGERVSWLVEKLKSFSSNGKKYGNTKHVFVSIGTNDGYVINDASKKKISELNDLIKKVYPNAKRVVVPGTYGWGTVENIKKQNQDAYYKMFTDLGFIYQYPNANALLQDVGKAHDPKQQWFIKSVEKIVSIKNS